jgi:hypothetical protein
MLTVGTAWAQAELAEFRIQTIVGVPSVFFFFAFPKSCAGFSQN